MPQLLGVYQKPNEVASIARKLRGRGFTDLETYSPAPFDDVEDALLEKPSAVRIFTLIGGLLGVVSGYALTIWMANDWPIEIGGKPHSSIPPFTIIAFELTILFGGLLTAVGLLVVGKLPSFSRDPGYSSRFSAEDFGVAVRCPERDVSEVDGLMRAEGAVEVNLVER